MAERIELPPMLQGDEKAQLHQLWSYLYQMSDALNNNLEAIGGNELTDSERKTMNTILTAGEQAKDQNDMETLKSLIIKTADFVQTTVQEWRMNLLGESVASGQFGRYVRHTGLDVEVTPEGITQNYSFEEVVQGLKEYAVNAKNYIKTGLLRTVSSIPVYGVAIGKDVVTFAEDGTETYNDGNKVAELTADELSFWQSGVKIASYTGNRISFYYNENEVMYIQNGKIYCTQDMELSSGKTIKIQDFNFTQNGMKYADDNGNIMEYGDYDNRDADSTVGIYSQSSVNAVPSIPASGNIYIKTATKNYGAAAWVERWMRIGWKKEGLYPGSIGLGITADANMFVGDNLYPVEALYGKTMISPTGELKLVCYDDNETGAGFNINKNSSKIILEGLGQYDHYVGSSNNPIYEVNARYYNTISSREKKHEIQQMKSQGDKLDALEPVTFIYNDDKKNRRRYGLIYEDAIQVMPEICTADEKDKGINYMDLIPVLLKEIQDLRRRVSELEGGR